MRAITTAARAVLGGYLAVHGAQKLFGSFGGAGLDGTAELFDKIGLTPGRQMAALAGATELGGGVLTATGALHPLGPVAVASTMAVATAVHRKAGPLATKGGYELPLTNLAFAVVLATARPGHHIGRRLPAARDRGWCCWSPARSAVWRSPSCWHRLHPRRPTPRRPRHPGAEAGPAGRACHGRGLTKSERIGRSHAKFALESSWIP